MSEHETTAVMEVKGVHWASSKAVAEAALSRRPGVLRVEANPVSQTANVTYDPARTSIKDLTGWVRECGFHCAGQSVPDHVCDPLQEDGTVERVTVLEAGPCPVTGIRTNDRDGYELAVTAGRPVPRAGGFAPEWGPKGPMVLLEGRMDRPAVGATGEHPSAPPPGRPPGRDGGSDRAQESPGPAAARRFRTLQEGITERS